MDSAEFDVQLNSAYEGTRVYIRNTCTISIAFLRLLCVVCCCWYCCRVSCLFLVEKAVARADDVQTVSALRKIRQWPRQQPFIRFWQIYCYFQRVHSYFLHLTSYWWIEIVYICICVLCVYAPLVLLKCVHNICSLHTVHWPVCIFVRCVFLKFSSSVLM